MTAHLHLCKPGNMYVKENILSVLPKNTVYFVTSTKQIYLKGIGINHKK